MWFSLVQESQVLIRSRGGRKRSLSENWLEHKPATTVDNGERRELEMRLWLSGQDKAHIHNLVHFCKHNQSILYCLFDQLTLFPARWDPAASAEEEKDIGSSEGARLPFSSGGQVLSATPGGGLRGRRWDQAVQGGGYEHQITYKLAQYTIYFSFNALPPSFIPILSISFLSPSLLLPLPLSLLSTSAGWDYAHTWWWYFSTVYWCGSTQTLEATDTETTKIDQVTCKSCARLTLVQLPQDTSLN